MVSEAVFKDRLKQYLMEEGVIDIDLQLIANPSVTIELLTPEGVGVYTWETDHG